MASLAVETSREAAKSPLLLNRVASTKKKFFFLNDIFLKSRIVFLKNFLIFFKKSKTMIYWYTYLGTFFHCE